MSGFILLLLYFIKQSTCFPVNSQTQCQYNVPFIRTKTATYCGFETKVEWDDQTANTVHIYYGIPYALPPVKNLRFRKPVAIPETPYRVVNASYHRPSCHQYNDTNYLNSAGARMWISPIEFDEDCLHLNVWVPQKSAPGVDENGEKPPEKLAVMVWIYGGAFATGAIGLEVYEGRYLAARQNVIVVSMNYRLGPFGFIYLKTGEIPGNMGLWDQRMALKWIKENIEYFGGDSERITIFGESAGAVSVSAHVISPWSQNLFRNGIMQSGTVLGYWGLINRDLSDEKTKKFMDQVGCKQGPLRQRVECMRDKPAKQLTDVHTYMYDLSSYFSVPFPPVVENHFFPYVTSQSFKHLSHLKPSGSLMFGVNKNEGSYFMLYTFVPNANWMNNKTEINITNDTDYDIKMMKVLDLDGSVPKSVLQITDFEYMNFDLPNTTKYKVERLEKIGSDRTFKCPTVEMARLVTNDNRFEKIGRRSVTLPTYFYEFRYRTKSLPWPDWMGTIHGHEIDYVFGIPFNKRFEKDFYKFSDDERRISDVIMQYWANFARTGDPNLMPNKKLISDDDVAIGGKPLRLWPEFDNNTESYLIFNDDGNVKTNIKIMKRKCTFWRRWYPVLLKEAKNQKQSKCKY